MVAAAGAPAAAVRPPGGVATDASTSPSGTADLRALATAWVQEHGDAEVRASFEGASTAGVVSVGALQRLSTWSPSFLDGSRPEAEPVGADVWAAPVTVADTVSGVLVVDVTSGVPEGSYVADASVAAALSSMSPDTTVVLDLTDDAWYLVSGDSVRAVGARAQQLLSGPVDLGSYGQVLRERRGLAGTASAVPQADTDSGVGQTMPVWITLIAVLVVVSVVILLVVRHERRVLTPLTVAPEPQAGRSDGGEGADAASAP